MTEGTFETVAIPANAYKRTAAVNPFDAPFKPVPVLDDKGQPTFDADVPVTAVPTDKAALAQSFPYDSDDHKKAVEALKRQARAAAKTVDRTARIVDEVFKEKDSKNVTHTCVKLTVWTVPRIVRKPKDATAEAEAAIAEAAK